MERPVVLLKDPNIIARISGDERPESAISALFINLIDQIGADAARLYRLSLKTSQFYVTVAHGQQNLEPPSVSYPARTVLDLKIPAKDEFAQTIRAGVPRFYDLSETGGASYDNRLKSKMLVPITSENQAVGLMEFFSLHPKYFNGDHANMLALITVPFFALLNDKERSLILFRNLQVPIDVDTDKSEFYQDVISLIEEASGVQKIVLRRFDSAHGRLKCLAQYGFEGTDVTTDLDFPSIPELFKDVIETGKRRIIRDIRSEVDGDQIANSLIYRDVLSCAIFPLRVGNSLLGTLSFALDFPYNFTNLEVEGFESIANSVAIAISNYESLLKSRRLRNQAIDVARLQFRVDVGHAFRHAARYDLDRAQLQLALIETEIKKRLYNKAIERINLASGSLHAISSHLDRLKQAVHDSVPTKSIVNVKALLEDAFFVMGEVLKAEEISWKIEIPNVEISTKPQILKEILCNLILNSRDAFRSNKVRQNKRIAVFMDKLSSSDKSLRMRFTDNAGGITVSKLRSPGKRPVSSVQDIFKPGITSKDEGSGYGMYLVRDFLGDLDGSIEIVDYRNGVTFAITLPV